MEDLPPFNLTMSEDPLHYSLVCEVMDNTKMTGLVNPEKSCNKLSSVVNPGWTDAVKERVVNPGSQ